MTVKFGDNKNAGVAITESTTTATVLELTSPEFDTSIVDATPSQQVSVEAYSSKVDFYFDYYHVRSPKIMAVVPARAEISGGILTALLPSKCVIYVLLQEKRSLCK